MTYRTIAMRILRYFGVSSLQPADNANVQNQQGLNDQDIPDVVSYIQGAAEEAYALCPSSMIERTAGAALRAPVNITIAVTKYSTTCTVTGWVSWMLGCTVRLEGDNTDNRFISATELVRPYMGETGSVSATVYADCIAIPATYCAVIEPVKLPFRARMLLAGSVEEFDRWNIAGYPNWHHGPFEHWIYTNKNIGEPIVARADFEALGTAQPALYLRFNPMPGQDYAVTYTGKLSPPTITEANIWDESDPDTDPGVSSFLPNAASILLAFALQRCTAHPNFSASGGQVTEIARQYNEAKRLLQARPAQFARNRATFAQY